MSFDQQLRLGRIGLRADDAIHPLHVPAHALDHAGPLRSSCSARIRQRMAWLHASRNGSPEGCSNLGNLGLVERLLRVARR